MAAFVINEPLKTLDPAVKRIMDIEIERQNRKLILIPSESSAPLAVLESLGSALQNIYAEGYPPEESRLFSQDQILDLESQLLSYRRYSDLRYYKGVEFIDVLEELARRRCAELFSNQKYPPEKIFVNIQPLSGAPANNAVYQALIEPGDVILGMNLFHGGHLTHGSSVNRSGKLYKVFHYSVSPETEMIEYDQLHQLAKENKPRIIISGYSSYPWVPDWKKFRSIADSVGAILFADISHIAGLVAAKAIPSPVGFADVITFTTHKSLCGPRGACILSFNENMAKKIDKAVFPGEQGGPHPQVFAGMATTFKLAKTAQFNDYQNQVIKNCSALTNQLLKRGIRIAYGGTNTHLTNIDCKTITGPDNVSLSGDMAARILDVAGIVANANTIPGDKSASRASGVRIGTPWITQRGLDEKDMVELANIIADLLTSMRPYKIDTGIKPLTRAKINFETLENCKLRVRDLCEKALKTSDYESQGYPFFSYKDDYKDFKSDDLFSFSIAGTGVRQILNYILIDDIEQISVGDQVKIHINMSGKIIPVIIFNKDDKEYFLSVNSPNAGLVSSWLRDLSDGYIFFDKELQKRIPGPFKVNDIKINPENNSHEISTPNRKPYFIGIDENAKQELPSLEPFVYHAVDNEVDLKRTALFEWHKNNGGKLIPFAGWEMPVWYSSVVEEHQATRKFAGLFDVSHMGVYQAEGKDALAFLDSVCANDIGALSVGESCYTHFLSPNAEVIDDLLVYHHSEDKYLVVVNASNDDKNWAWLNAVRDGKVLVDNTRPYARCFGNGVILRNLRDPGEKENMRVDIAIQGPISRQILLGLDFSKNDKFKLESLKRTQLCHAKWQDYDLIISRTGYTGEKIAYEIFLHPDASVLLWDALIKIGKPFGLKPCGLGARDSLRTEAGLPLYGHEMGGDLGLGVGEAGFSSYVKTYKPWFIGRTSFIQREKTRNRIVSRFRFNQQRVKVAHAGDPVLNVKGKVIGFVTSCAIDTEEYLTGQALVEKEFSIEGTEVFIIQRASELKELSFGKLSVGDRIPFPASAKIVSRFARL